MISYIVVLYVSLIFIPEPTKKRKRSYSRSSSGSSSSSSDSEEESERKKDKTEEEKVEKETKENKTAEDEIHSVEDEVVKPEKPKSLHKTTSIFLRNLAPTITKQEVEATCSRYVQKNYVLMRY